MDITIQNQKRTAQFANGRFYQTFTPRTAHDVLRIHHDADCIGDTQLRKIQLEQGSQPTAFETPQVTHRALSGLFADLRSLNLELTNPNSTFWGKIRANNSGMLVEYYNKTIKSEMALTADAVSSRITSLINGDYSSFDQRLNALQAQVKNAAVTSTVQQLADKYTRQIEAIDGRVSTVQQKADSLTSRIAQAEKGVSDVTQTATSLQTTVKDLSGNYSAMRQTVQGLQSTISAVDGRQTTLKQTVDGIQTSISTLNGNYSDLTRTVNGVTSTVKTVNDKVDKETGKLTSSISSLQQTSRSIQSTVDNLNGTISQLRQTDSSLSSRITQAQSTATGAADKASEVKQTIDTISTYIGDRRGKYTSLTQDIEGLRSKVSDGESNYSSVRQSINAINADVATLKSRNSVSVTTRGIVLSSGEVVDGKKLASMIALDSQNVSIIAKQMRVDGNMLVNGSVTADKLAANSVTAGKIQAGAINGTHITADSALVTKLLAQDAFIRELTAKRAFINSVSAIRADITEADIRKITASQIFSGAVAAHKITASQITTDSLRGKTIIGGTLQGNTRIQIGESGWLAPVGDVLQIRVPSSVGGTSGVGMQIYGHIWNADKDTPSGVYIYPDPQFGSGRLYELTDDKLFTVRGRIRGNFRHNGNNHMGTAIMTNDKYAVPVGGLYGIRFIGWDPNAHNKDGAVYFDDGTGSSGTWRVYPDSGTSDKRLKENIKSTSNKALDIVEKLPFYEFDWKPNRFGNRKLHTNIGMLADDLQQLDASLVFEEGDDNIKKVDEFRLLNVAVKAIQELNTKLTQLERKIAHE